MEGALSREIWAKSPRGGQTAGESLHTHTQLVVARLAQLRRRLPALADAAADPEIWQRAFWACVLHDVGKAAEPFQRVLRGEARSWGQRHEVASLAFLPWVLPEADDQRPWVAAAIASHHRDASVIDEIYPFDRPADIAFERLFGGFSDETLAHLRDWLRAAPLRWAREYGFDGAESGLEAAPSVLDGRRFRDQDAPDAVLACLQNYNRLCRNLEREEASSAANRRGLLTRGLILLADRLASAHARELDVLHMPEAAALLAAAGGVDGARNYQSAAGATMSSVVVSAPTGSGKTEAALWWASAQQQAEPHRQRLLYLLPYQASLNAMKARLDATLGVETGLLHGRAAQALYRGLLAEGMDGERAERVARRATDLAHLQVPSVHVATPYQLLRGAFRLPGYEMQWASLHGALIAIDEVHAYQPERLGLFLGLLAHLVQRWDVRVCALTATMPSWLRDLLVQRLGATAVAASRADFAKFARHQLRLIPGDLPAVIPAVTARVEAGEAVLVAANTVSDAQALYRTLQAVLGTTRVRLLHSRFIGQDRLRHEQELMRAVGLGVKQRMPLVVVATQTIEVSLNLDFDTIYSAPAPLEALAQRFGRVNRTGRLKSAPVNVLLQPDDGQGVYDSRLVQASLGALRKRDGLVLDEAELGSMLDEVYADGLAEEFTAAVLVHEREFTASCLYDLRAFQSDDQLAEKFDALFDGVEVVPASFENEFTTLVADSPLAAQGYLVPISYRQLSRLRRDQRIRKLDGGFHIVDLPYNAETGLALSRPGQVADSE